MTPEKRRETRDLIARLRADATNWRTVAKQAEAERDAATARVGELALALADRL